MLQERMWIVVTLVNISQVEFILINKHIKKSNMSAVIKWGMLSHDIE